ncbi:MAG: hypothetical protein HYT62_04510 [Candidatus Yanofskybacteria bacterium]|nr:hypothetical protein [Candidatus Yanofskybacteria bacterium]
MKNFTILSVLILGVIASQYFFDLIRPKYSEVPPILLPVQAVKLSDLGLHSAVSGFIWVQAIQNIFTPGTKHQLLLPDYLNLVVDLDPRFSYPYAFGTLVLPDLNFVDEAIKIGERGLREADSDWRIPYYLATTYHIFKHDRINAIKYFDIASRMTDAPDSVKRVAINYGTAPDIRQQTKQIWFSIFETSNDELVRERAKLYILHYEYMEILEKAAGIYKQKFGSYPENLDKLITARILKEIPKDPFGFEYTIDSRGRVNIRIE